MKVLLKQSMAGLRVLVVLTVLLGVLYPLGVWLVSRVPGLQANAEGSVVEQNGTAVGSSLIGVDPVPADPAHDPWFHNRPSAGSKDSLGPGDPSTSGGSNKAATNEDLVKTVVERRDLIAKRENVAPEAVPTDAVTASASGLDPSISPAYAALQATRVAANTGVPVDKIHQLIDANTHSAGIGMPGVNVLELNLAVQHAR
ncbi:potassium-transporting ATPase subunit C [Amycolatopsis minnesotensis]|uniref:Potassium-transporting ATPase KdpC subunit n=1 Tax=Amycolatopsis minnesotensis TaxID=337894 RepID=A0ABN2RX22_9PSEU